MLPCSKDTDQSQSRDTVRHLSAPTQPSINAVARQSRTASPSAGKRQSPVLRPDSTVMSEERGAVPDNSDHDRTQSTSCSSASDSTGGGLSTTQSQRPPLWNPFLAAVSSMPGGDSESERRLRDPGTLPPDKVGGAGTKHSRPSDDDAVSPAKKRKTNSEVHESSGCVELSEAGLRPSGQSPSSSTLDTQAPATHNSDPVMTDAQDSGGSGGVCAPDSSCDEHLSSDVKRFERVKDANISSVQKDLTVVGGVQETGALLPVATQ